MHSTSSGSARRISRRCGGSSSRCREAAALVLGAVALFGILSVTVSARADEGGTFVLKPPYVIITRDGHRIDAMTRPSAEGERVLVRLYPHGVLAALPAGEIDWPATEKFNAQAPAPAAPPPAPKPREGVAEIGRSPSGVIEMKIIGGGKAIASVHAEGSGAPAARAAAPPAVPPAMDPNAAAAQLSALRREMDVLKKLREDLTRSKAQIETQISDLDARISRDAPHYSDEKVSATPTRRALDQARANLQSVNDQLATIERRMNEIRNKAVDLGSAVD